MTVTDEICKAFNRGARGYEAAAGIQQEIGRRLIARLDYLKMTPERILDLGCGPGHFSALLRKRYPKARIVGVDIAADMLAQSQKRQGLWRNRWQLVNADMLRLPFAPDTFDLVFANQTVHWAPSLKDVFAEIHRVMRPAGALYFSTLGPDTFCEMREAFARADSHAHANTFADMHDVGDALAAVLFEDTVMDMEKIRVRYASADALLQSLKAQGVRNIHPQRNRGLTGSGVFRRFREAYAGLSDTDGKCPLTYEVVYGHAWRGASRKEGHAIETVIPLSSIGRVSRP